MSLDTYPDNVLQGSVLVLSANLTAGLLSFTLARTIGRQLAQKVIQEEVGEGEGKAGVRAALQKVEDTIESGTFAQQCTSILLLRLTPIVPFRCCCCCCCPSHHVHGVGYCVPAAGCWARQCTCKHRGQGAGWHQGYFVAEYTLAAAYAMAGLHSQAPADTGSQACSMSAHCALGACSASNYLLGLTPLQYPPFIVGSVGGMAVWAVIYASIGGAGRTLLQSGVSLNDVFAGMQLLSLAPCPLAAWASLPSLSPASLVAHNMFVEDPQCAEVVARAVSSPRIYIRAQASRQTWERTPRMQQSLHFVRGLLCWPGREPSWSSLASHCVFPALTRMTLIRSLMPRNDRPISQGMMCGGVYVLRISQL